MVNQDPQNNLSDRQYRKKFHQVMQPLFKPKGKIYIVSLKKSRLAYHLELKCRMPVILQLKTAFFCIQQSVFFITDKLGSKSTLVSILVTTQKIVVLDSFCSLYRYIFLSSFVAKKQKSFHNHTTEVIKLRHKYNWFLSSS